MAELEGPTKKAELATGGFEAAAYTKNRSWIYDTTSDESVNPPTYARTKIVSLTRYLVNNYSLCERILSVSEIYGVGPGLSANATTKDPDFNTANTEAFDNWASSCFCSANNQYNLYEMQKLIVRELIIAGEVFIVLVKSPSGYPQLMLVPTESVKHSGEQSDDSIDGLYLDPFSKVIAYNIFTGKNYQKVDASNVIHLMRHKQIGQLRGIGSFAASLNSLRDHKDLIVLEKKAVKVHSALAAVVKKQSGEAGPTGLFGDPQPASVTGIVATSPVNSNIGLEKAFGGNVVYTEPNEQVDLLTSKRSTEGFMNFLELLLRDVCLNLSIPYEFLVDAKSLTGVGVRFVLSDAAFFFSNLQNILIDGAMQRIYGWVTASFINDKKVQAPNGDLPYAVSWTKPISITIDPSRASNADIALMQNSMTTFETYYSARGKNWVHELRQHALEEQYLNQLSEETGVAIGRLRTLPQGSPMLDISGGVVDTESQQAA